MTYSVDFILEGLPKLQTNSYGHWRTRHAEKSHWERRVGGVLLGRVPSEPLERVTVEFTRFSTSEPDFDNLVASFKPICDGLIKAGVIVDDKPSNIGSPTYRWEKAKRGEGRIHVHVREVGHEPEG